MQKNTLQEKVFEYFYNICSIPHGSGNTAPLAEWCVDFAKKRNLAVVKDEANNVVIYKDASSGYENSAPVILQGHLDMVCQSDDEFDFTKNALEVYTDGDFIKAKGTTLGADNGIALAMILAILDSDTLAHPPIEAVFTSDEEIGMVGALHLDTKLLKSKRMINIDSEEEHKLTVSCAGGRDVKIEIPLVREKTSGTLVKISFEKLLSGHSGVEIDKGRVNADSLMARVLNHMQKLFDFSLVSISGGGKSNAIPGEAKAEIVVKDADKFILETEKYLNVIKEEISAREPNFVFSVKGLEKGDFNSIEKTLSEKITNFLVASPVGVINMSAQIKGLVETSINLGILDCNDNTLTAVFSLRSNKMSCLDALEERLLALSSMLVCKVTLFGHYPSWDFQENSKLQELYKKCFFDTFEKNVEIEAIHAGLECGVFASQIENLDCISIGPDLFDVHTTNEKLSISSVSRVFNVLLSVLEKLK